MISINTDKKLNIILPNTNKALKTTLKDASEQELGSITKGKDLKGIIGSLLKESSQNSTSDKTLLNLVKNNPTLQDLGSANQNLKDLLNTLKSDKNLQHVEKVLQKFMPDMQDVKNTDLKNTLENSGVFLESKLKDIKEPQTKLKTNLETLSAELQKSKNPNAKALNKQVQELINSIPTKQSAKENPKLQENLAKSTQDIVKNITKELKNADPTTTKEFTQKLDKVQHLLEPKNLEKANFNADTLKNSIKDLATTLKNTYTKEASSASSTLDKTLQQLTEPKQDITKATNEIIKDIQNLKQTPNTSKIVSELKNLQGLSSKQVQESLQQMIQNIDTTQTKDSKTIVDLLNKILKPLQNQEQTPDKKITQDIKNIVQNLKINIAKADPIHSDKIKSSLKELSQLNSPAKLSPEQNIKDILNNDLKAVLQKASQEVSKVQSPNQEDVLKQIDKLSLQIDYYQLVSHLSDSSSLYIPFSWEQMQDGEVSIKHSKDDKFYCDIELKLKDYGELNVRLTLYDKNQLNINIHSDSEELKTIMKDAIPELRKSLIDIQITPREIRLHEKTKEQTPTSVYNEIAQDLEMGFEVRG